MIAFCNCNTDREKDSYIDVNLALMQTDKMSPNFEKNVEK